MQVPVTVNTCYSNGFPSQHVSQRSEPQRMRVGQCLCSSECRLRSGIPLWPALLSEQCWFLEAESVGFGKTPGCVTLQFS